MLRNRAFLLVALVTCVALGGPLAIPVERATAFPMQGTYPTNGTEPIENCPDPAITSVENHPADGATHWYMFCTGNPLNDGDLATNHLIAILESTDLVTWKYVGDVFATRPRSVASGAGLWAPDIHWYNGTWYLYYSVSRRTANNSPHSTGSYINVATTTNAVPSSGWQDQGQVVESQPNRWVIDPHVVVEGTTRYIFYGSYAGGISARRLSADGLRSAKASETRITVADRYEGAHIVRRNGFYYLFVSATACCNGPLTGYSVFVGRSANLLGPYVDREGVSLLDSRVGGTPVISMNGNRWVGPGHNALLTDYAGQDWFVYHAVNRDDAYFLGTGYTKRWAQVDPLDWLDATGARHTDPNGGADVWPTVRGGRWASPGWANTDESGNPLQPAAQPRQAVAYTYQAVTADTPGTAFAGLSDEFDDGLGEQWGWVRPPRAGTYGLTGGAFWFNTQAADLYQDRNDASVLVEPTPDVDYVVETRVHLNVPASGSGYNYVQAGLVIYGDDNSYLKLVHVAINGTRQTEYAKETAAGPRYGNTAVGPPSDWTYLRIVKRANPAPIDPNGGDKELYTAYTSRDGATWVRGGTWTHSLGPAARIGLVAMSGSGFTANFDYVRVSSVAP